MGGLARVLAAGQSGVVTTVAAAPTAVRVEPAYADPGAVLAAVRGVEEYWPLARYAASPEEMIATGGDPNTAMYVPPWFRRDFALGGEALVPGAGLILGNERFVAATHEVFGGDAVVVPTTVYVNVMLPSVAPFVPHIDVPAFRGVTRADQPVWLLQLMLHSGLFEQWRVKLATAVSWFYDGPGGAFHYWPGGPSAPSASIEPPYGNVAVLADNERTYHGVAPVGGAEARFVTGLTRDSLLHRVDGGWEMRNGTETVGSGSDAEARVTVSWKAEVYAGAEEHRRALDHQDDLDLDQVIDRFLADLRERGVEVAAPDDPHHDPAWVRLLSETYGKAGPRVPTA